MTMVKSERRVPAGEFKAKCLALLDEVAASGESLVVSKHGKPVARVVPFDEAAAPSLQGSILDQKDLVTPIDESWEAER